LFERLEEDAFPRLQVVLTKADLVDEAQLEAASSIVEALALPPALAVSSSTGEGIEALRDQILTMLHGAPVDLVILLPKEEGDLAVGAWMAQCHEIGAMISSEPNAEGGVECRLWVEEGDLARLLVKASGQVRVRGESGEQS
jgi:50S ribosomal subunit-associated GTPase HflX